MTNQINFIYTHCSPADFEKDISFSEVEFRDILEECFIMKTSMAHIDVHIERHDGQATGKFSCAINLISPSNTLYVKDESEDNFAQTVRNCCKKAVSLMREEKAKQTKTRNDDQTL